MLYRPRAVAFLVPNGVDGFADDVKALLFSLNYSRADYCPDYRDDPNYNDEPVLWIAQDDLDVVLQNNNFWGYLIDGSVKSYKNFNIKTKSDMIDTPNDGMSNDNTIAIFMCDDSSLINSDVEYLPDSEYQSDFVLTAEYIDDKTYIKDWIRGRGIEENFDMTKTVGELKEDIKIYYNLIGAEDV